MDTEEYLLIDTDSGSDDAFAIMLAIHALQNNKIGNKKLLGIICCPGNTRIDNVTRNVALTLKIMNANNVKVYRGSHCSLLKKTDSIEYYGSDGLGNCTSYYNNDDDTVKIENKNGILAMVDFVRMYPKKVTILCLGPLTNLALAYLLDKQFFQLTKQLYVLGGNIKALGNVTPSAEFNFHFDPEAAHITLNNCKCPITIVPWEPCKKKSLAWDCYDALIAIKTEKALFFERATKDVVSRIRDQQYCPGMEWADVVLVAAFLNQNVVLKTHKWRAFIELNGELTRGQLVVDREQENEDGFTFITKVDDNVVFEMLKTTLST